MTKDARFIYSDDQLNYSFSEEHPFNQKRITLTLDLLKEINAISAEHIVKPRMATDEEILLIHEEKFVNIVKKASKGDLLTAEGEVFGIGTEEIGRAHV